jgi:pimeloyl-ACP methyl ester carboxylesterase
MRRGYVDSTCGQVHYRSAGEGDQALVLLHHTAGSSRVFEPVMQHLTGDARLVALDTPGFGGSDPWPTPPSTTDLVEALVAAVAALGLTSYHLLGHHSGAALATEWAATHPGNVRSLTLVGALAMGSDERRRWLEGVADFPLRDDGSHLAAAWQRAGRDAGGDLQARHLDACEILLAAPRWPEAYRAVFSQDYEAFLRAVTCPTVLISGEDDTLRSYVEATAAVSPQLRTVLLEGGSAVVEHRADEVARVLREQLVRAG